MSLPAGRLSNQVRIDQRTPPGTVDAAGQPLAAWTPLVTLWADIKAPTGLAAAERLTADRETSLATYSLRIRYRTDITPAMRAVHLSTGTVFDIDQVLPDLANREHTDLVCTTGGTA